MTPVPRTPRQGDLVDLIVRLYPRHVRDRFEEGIRDSLSRDHARARARGWAALLMFLWWSAIDAGRARVRGRLDAASTRHALLMPEQGGSFVRSFTSSWLLDWRDAFRSLRGTPVVTLVAVLSLGLGIGANTALFSIVNGLVLKTLPVRDPASLVMLEGDSWTNPIWEEIRARDRDLFGGAAAFSPTEFNLSPSGATDIVPGLFVSGSFFDLLGVPPMEGRALGPADDVRGTSAAVAMVGHDFWQRRLGGRADAIGRLLQIDRTSFTVVGVMPPGFFGPIVGERADIVVPIAAREMMTGDSRWFDGRERWWLEIMLRTRPGQSADDATAALRGVQPQIREATAPERRSGTPSRHLRGDLTLIPAGGGESSLRDAFQRPLTIVMVVVGAVLLIACANIASLLLARAAARRHEFAIRLALGASAWRVRRLLLVESVLLALAGAALGLLIAPFGANLLVSQLGGAMYLDAGIDWRVLAFTTSVAALTAIFFGLAPATAIAKLTALGSLTSQTRVAGDRTLGLRQLIVVSQVALSLALVVAAGLFVRTFATLTQSPLGFDPAHLALVTLNLPRAEDGRAEQLARVEALRVAAAATPGVRAAAISVITPIGGGGWNTKLERPGLPALTDVDQMSWVNAVSPEFFDAYGMRLLAGRGFTATDRTGAPRVTVVTENFARRFFPGVPAVGQLVRGPHAEPAVIVGVVSDMAFRSARTGMTVTMFVPAAQEDGSGRPVLTGAAHSDVTPETLHAVGQQLTVADPAASFTTVLLGDRVRVSVARERLLALLSGFFGALALLLAAIGLYGVTSYSVQQRRREIGVRMALGSDRARIVRLVLRRVGSMVAAGVALGSALALGTAKLVESLLFGLSARDPLTVVLAAAALAAVAFLAAALPARRASRLDPTEVLRS